MSASIKYVQSAAAVFSLLCSRRKRGKNASEQQQRNDKFDYVLGFAKPRRDGVTTSKTKAAIMGSLVHMPSLPDVDESHPDAPSLSEAVRNAILSFDPQATVTALDSKDFALKLIGIAFSEEVLEAEAEEKRIIKLTTTGLTIPFAVRLRSAFPQLKGGTLFTTAERTRLTMEILEEIEVRKDKDGMPESVADMMALDLCQGFPVHEESELDWLHNNWVSKPSATFRQPLDHIALYFGESIAFYFAWLQHYSVALLLPAGLGLLVYLVQPSADSGGGFITVLFSLFMAIWGSVVTKMWKRKQSNLAHDWGVLGYEMEERVRPQHVGDTFTNPLTGKPDRAEKAWKQLLRFMAVTIPVMLVMISLSVLYMFFCEHLRVILTYHLDGSADASKSVDVDKLSDESEHNLFPLLSSILLPSDVDAGGRRRLTFLPSWLKQVLSLLPTILFAVGVPMLDKVNGAVATRLTEFENHRTDTDYENSLIAKQALLQFLNNFISLFHIAFVQQNLDLLRQRLVVLLVWKALLNNVQEVFMPIVMSEASVLVTKVEGQRTHRRSVSEAMQQTPKQSSGGTPKDQPPSLLQATQRAISSLTPAQIESQLQKYDPYDDILEMYIQFGHVMLFSAVFPLAPLFALLNNIVEVHSDALKLCNMQRPFPRRTANLGAWTFAFETLGYVAVASNVALFGVAARQQGAFMQWDSLTFMLFCVMLEHAFIALKVLMERKVPDIPGTLRSKILLETKLRNQLAGATGQRRSSGTPAASLPIPLAPPILAFAETNSSIAPHGSSPVDPKKKD